MRKSKLLIAFAAVSILGLSLPAIATADYSIATPDCCIATPDCSGIYFGLQGGYTHTDYDLGDFFDKHISEDDFAGRASLGYQFNQYLGLETGFTMLVGTELPKDFGDVHTTYWDLMVKAGMPFGNSGFRGDLRAGGAHVRTKFDANDIAESLGLDDVTEWKIKPIAGASISYNITSNLVFDVSYFHIFGNPKHSSFNTPTTDLALVGVSFHFPVF